ncbi:MAG: pyrroline-5-carboxylate reductase [Alphaproteobacteria bacterium]|nr:pyrroline-5-carboxylate reductase [Alphaproteobacteria bacterium]
MALKVALVGCGAIGSALLQGWLSLADSSERFEKFWVIAPHREKVEPFLTDTRVQWLISAEELHLTPDIIVFALKPYVLEGILPFYTTHKSLFISVAAGKPLSFYHEFLSPSAPLIRAMPNTPVIIHQGVIGLLTMTDLTEQQKGMIATCFQGLGLCVWVNSDDELDKLTAISGSGPAYVFAMIEALAKSAESLGFDPKTALDLALHTFLGASYYAQQSEEHPSLLRQGVTSPGGTTAAALRVLETGKVGNLINDAINAAYQRARELSE